MISSPGCAGRQCSAIAPGRGAVEQRVVESVGRERLAAPRRLGVVVAHRDPDVGVERVGAGGRLRRVVGELRAVGLGAAAAPPARRSRTSRPAVGAEDRERARDVVAVADVGEHAAAQVAERLAQRHQVGERLARVVAGREHVHDRHLRVRGELAQALLAAGAQADRRGVAGEHERRVADRLPARELELVRAQHHRVAAELVDAGLHRRARARRGVLEQQRDRAALEHARGGGLGLQLERAVEQGVQLVGAELLAGEEVARQVRTVPSTHALTPAPRCSRWPPRSPRAAAATTSEAAPTSHAAPAAHGDTVAVTMKDILFKPEHVTARVGQTVRWTNEDAVAHNVKAEAGAKFESKTLDGGRHLRAEDHRHGRDRLCLHDPPEPEGLDQTSTE